MSGSMAIRFGKRRKPRTHAPTGKPSVETCPPGERWPYCGLCNVFAAVVGTDGHGRELRAYITPERARELGWLGAEMRCPGCGKTKLGRRIAHPLAEGIKS